MADQRTANVYSQALFEAAEDAGSLAATSADLAAFVEAMQRSRELTAVLYNPQISSIQKKRIVKDLTAGGDRIFVNGINLLIDKRHPDLIPEVYDGFTRLLQKKNKVVEVEIVSAIELPEETKAKIRDRIAAATGKQIDMKAIVREDVVGGLILRIGDIIVDGSLKAKLQQLHNRLARATIVGSEDSFETAS
ncbi:MAG: ATP synthase F1 subunit delta [Actinobacteria bacterium]|nr:ATP synthase F1 subunit delta [Actinomycetota bacterium]